MAREEAQCEIVVEAIELGAAGYLEKTSAPETLLTKIQETLGLSRRTLNEKMQRLGIQRDKPNQPAPNLGEHPRERIADDSA